MYYIPKRWKSERHIHRLINSKYEKESFRIVHDTITAMKIGDLDYFMYDYVREILYDTFVNAKLDFVTSIELRTDPEFTYMPHDCFHFIVKKDDILRKKTAIVEFEMCDEIVENVRITYEKYLKVAEPYILSLKNIGHVLKSFLPQSEIDFVVHNVKAFKIEHQHWITGVFLQDALSHPKLEYSRDTMVDCTKETNQEFISDVKTSLAQL